MAIVVGGLAKLFVGELVETSTEVLGERIDLKTSKDGGHTESLSVDHIQ